MSPSWAAATADPLLGLLGAGAGEGRAKIAICNDRHTFWEWAGAQPRPFVQGTEAVAHTVLVDD